MTIKGYISLAISILLLYVPYTIINKAQTAHFGSAWLDAGIVIPVSIITGVFSFMFAFISGYFLTGGSNGNNEMDINSWWNSSFTSSLSDAKK